MKKEKKNNVVLIILLLLLVVCIALPLVYFLVIKDNDKEPSKKEEVKLLWETPNYTNKLDVYGAEYGICPEANDTCNKLVFSIPTETENAKILLSEEDFSSKFVIYDDNGLKIYRISDKKVYTTKLKNDYDVYKVVPTEDEKSVVGIIQMKSKYLDNIFESFFKNVSFYNFETDKDMYNDAGYNSLYLIDSKYIGGITLTDIYDEDNYKSSDFVLSIDKEEVIYSEANAGFFSALKTNFGKVYLQKEYNAVSDGDIVEVYSSQFKKLNTDERFYIGSNGIYTMNVNNINYYNADGKLLNSYPSSGNVIALYDGIYITVYNNKLYFKDVSGTTSEEILTWKDNYSLDALFSGYYDKERLQEEKSEHKEEGWYFAFQEDIECSGIEVYYNPKTKEIKTSNVSYFGHD